MTASERSYLGFGKQTAKGTPQTTDASFTYMLLLEGGIGPNNQVIPLDQEIGGGALPRDVVRTGVVTTGAMNFIPRPNSIAKLLTAAIGKDTVSGAGPDYSHAITHNTDQFSIPYYTWRVMPGGLWGETFQDVRAQSLSLAWRAGDYLRGQISLLGGTPTPNVTTSGWSPSTYIDSGPQFLATEQQIQVPTGTNIKVLRGSFTAINQIPLDEQWIVGSYAPDDFEINQKAYTINLICKVSDATLYNKMLYDPSNGSAWTADMFREADILLKFESPTEVDTGIPYSIDINASSGTENIVWTAEPIALRAGRQVLLAITGVVLADSSSEPLTITVVNGTSAAS